MDPPLLQLASDYWAFGDDEQNQAGRLEGKHVTSILFGQALLIPREDLEEHLSDEIQSRRTFVKKLPDGNCAHYYLGREAILQPVVMGEGAKRRQYAGMNVLNRLLLLYPEMEKPEKAEANFEICFIDEIPERYQRDSISELIQQVCGDPDVPEDMKILVGVSTVRGSSKAVMCFQQETLAVREALELEEQLSSDDDSSYEEVPARRGKRPIAQSQSSTAEPTSSKRARLTNSELKKLSSHNAPGLISELEESRILYRTTLESILTAVTHLGELQGQHLQILLERQDRILDRHERKIEALLDRHERNTEAFLEHLRGEGSKVDSESSSKTGPASGFTVS
jgi:hypothetical protein